MHMLSFNTATYSLYMYSYVQAHPYSTLVFGVFPLHQIAHVGRHERMGLSYSLFGREIIFE